MKFSLIKGLCFLFFIFYGVCPAAVDIRPVGRQVEILPPGQDFVWQIKAEPAVPGAALTWQVLGWNGESLTEPALLFFNGDEAQIRYKPVKLGWQELLVTARDTSGTVVLETRRGFVSGETRKLDPDDFKYGVCCHLRIGQTYWNDLDVIDKLGVAYVRYSPEWSQIQPKEADQWNWNHFDTVVDDMVKRQIQLDAILAFTPDWASSQPGTPQAIRVAPQMEPWLAYVRAAVGRYKDRIRYWEIWNEPDIGFWQSSTADFATLFSETGKAIRETNPQAIVLNGGFALIPRKPNLTFLDDFLPKADRTNWNIFAYHDYQTFAEMLDRRKQVADLSDKYKITLPIWINEGGLNSVGKGREHFQAVTLVKKLATAPSLGLKSYFIYDLRNDGTDPNNSEHNFGLIHNDYSAKPSFAVCQNLFRLLGGRKFLRTEHVSENNIWNQIYAGRTPEDNQLSTLWTENSEGSMLVWFDKIQNAEVLDVMGNPVPHASSPAGTLLSIGNEPVYFCAKAEGDWCPKPVMTTPSLIPLVAGTSNPASLSFTNPLDQPVQLILETSAVTGGIHPFKNPPLEIKPGETSSIPLNLDCDTVLAPHPQVALLVTLNSVASEISLPVAVVHQIPAVQITAGGFELGQNEGSSIVLRGAESVVNLFSAEPRDDMHWHGPNDLSVEARMGYDQEALDLTAMVTDDIHAQTHSGDQIWNGDSLQLAIQPNPNQKTYFEIALALTNSGQTSGWIYQTPDKSPLSLGLLDDKNIPCSVRREKTSTVYVLKIPWSALGLDHPPKSAFRLNFLVNDDDGKGRKQWIQLSDGIGRVKNPALFPTFICR